MQSEDSLVLIVSEIGSALSSRAEGILATLERGGMTGVRLSWELTLTLSSGGESQRIAVNGHKTLPKELEPTSSLTDSKPPMPPDTTQS